MPGQPSQPGAKGDWPASKQAIVIGVCILSVVILVIAAILGAASSSGAAPQAGSTVTITATATKTVKVRVTKKPKPAPTETVTVTARPKSRSAGGNASRNCTPGYSPCLAPASDYDCRGGSGNGPKYTGPVRVTGSDPYDLDRDGDGKACEWS
jgi:hypothetical protein